jgi:hypothetical protein
VSELPVLVGRAPPTVKVEIIPPPPASYRDPRWIDGQWVWSASAGDEGEGRWRWVAGQWVDWRGSKAWYAPATLTVSSGGRLAWRPGHTHQPSEGATTAPATRSAPGATGAPGARSASAPGAAPETVGAPATGAPATSAAPVVAPTP